MQTDEHPSACPPQKPSLERMGSAPISNAFCDITPQIWGMDQGWGAIISDVGPSHIRQDSTASGNITRPRGCCNSLNPIIHFADATVAILRSQSNVHGRHRWETDVPYTDEILSSSCHPQTEFGVSARMTGGSGGTLAAGVGTSTESISSSGSLKSQIKVSEMISPPLLGLNLGQCSADRAG